MIPVGQESGEAGSGEPPSAGVAVALDKPREARDLVIATRTVN